MDRDQVIELLGLTPLPHEGGRHAETFGDGHSSAIYFLVEAGQPTRLHRLPGTELFHFYAGDAARLLLLEPGGEVSEPVLGTDLAAGERPQVPVPGGCWQALECLGEWSLLGTTMAPPFSWSDWEAAEREALLADWPQAAERIERHS